ncbi:uncharacterized protein LOC107304196 [Oryza brachyantha]|uniref:uncharacterized protein LOC107304196 n=1 Tax=Oryza brachyantha TaxID=4533 RepID=UPI00077645D8|nr:uncharacterized protein LOC107304196 [Oryza brachyantha]
MHLSSVLTLLRPHSARPNLQPRIPNPNPTPTQILSPHPDSTVKIHPCAVLRAGFEVKAQFGRHKSSCSWRKEGRLRFSLFFLLPRLEGLRVGCGSGALMVARMWSWPPPARKFRVRLVVRRADGLAPPPASSSSPGASPEAAATKVAVEVRWKGPRASPLGSLRRVMHSNRMRLVAPAAAVAWKEFERVETFTATSHRKATASFYPWDLAFSVSNDSNKGPKGELVMGTVSVNLAEYTSSAEEVEIILPLSVPNGASESSPSLHVVFLKSMEQSAGLTKEYLYFSSEYTSTYIKPHLLGKKTTITASTLGTTPSSMTITMSTDDRCNITAGWTKFVTQSVLSTSAPRMAMYMQPFISFECTLDEEKTPLLPLCQLTCCYNLATQLYVITTMNHESPDITNQLYPCMTA